MTPTIRIPKKFRGVALCYAILAAVVGSAGCSRSSEMSGGSWGVANGQVIIDQGTYRFGKGNCHYRFRLRNDTGRKLEIKTMIDLLDASGNEVDTVIASMFEILAPGEVKIHKGFFALTKEHVRQTATVEAKVDHAYISK